MPSLELPRHASRPSLPRGAVLLVLGLLLGVVLGWAYGPAWANGVTARAELVEQEQPAPSCCPIHTPIEDPSEEHCPPGCHDCPGCALGGTVVPVSHTPMPPLPCSPPVAQGAPERLQFVRESPTEGIFHPPRSVVQA